ncbi:MAG: hypothetical protein ACI4O7_15745 [Aristaeellaceae bacterium]
MAIVPNWTDPLEEALRKLVSSASMTEENIRQIRDTASLLEGTPVPERIGQCITEREEHQRRLAELAAERKAQHTESTYQSGLSYISLDHIASIEQGIKALEQVRGYKDADAKVQEAHQKIARIRKKQRITKLAKVAAVFAVILGIVLGTAISKQMLRNKIADAQSLADAGQNSEALTIVAELYGKGKNGVAYPGIYTVTETVLENTASQEGLSAACTLMDQLSGDMPYAVEADVFASYAAAHLTSDSLPVTEQVEVLFWLNDNGVNDIQGAEEIIAAYLETLPLAEAAIAALDACDSAILSSSSDVLQTYLRRAAADLPAEEAWPMLSRAADMKVIGLDADFVQPAAAAYAAALDSEQAWTFIARMQDDLQRDTLVQMISRQLDALTEDIRAGTNVEMDAWMNAHGALLDQIGAEPDAALQLLYALDDAGYDAAALFPEGISVRIPLAAAICSTVDDLFSSNESDEFPSLTAMLPVSIREKNIDAIASAQSFLDELTASVEALRMDDDRYDIRLLPEHLFRIPASARPATFDDCTSLLCMQQVYSINCTISRTTNNLITKHYPAYYALDMVTLLGMQEPYIYSAIAWQVHPPKVDDDEWFEEYKNSTTVSVISNQYLMGTFDTETLKKDFEPYFTLFLILGQS